MEEERAFFMMKDKMSMSPLVWGDGEPGVGEIVVFFDARLRKKLTPAHECALEYDNYDVSL